MKHFIGLCSVNLTIMCHETWNAAVDRLSDLSF